MNTIRFRFLKSFWPVPSAKISVLCKALHDEVHKSLVSTDWSVKICHIILLALKFFQDSLIYQPF